MSLLSETAKSVDLQSDGTSLQDTSKPQPKPVDIPSEPIDLGQYKSKKEAINTSAGVSTQNEPESIDTGATPPSPAKSQALQPIDTGTMPPAPSKDATPVDNPDPEPVDPSPRYDTLPDERDEDLPQLPETRPPEGTTDDIVIEDDGNSSGLAIGMAIVGALGLGLWLATRSDTDAD